MNPAMTIGAFVSACLLTILVGGPFIHRLSRFRGQIIREDAPLRHQEKAGTPTMGGLFFLPLGFLVALLFSGPSALPLILLGGAFFLLGFLDDYLSLKRGKNLGLKARQKIAGQILASFLFSFWCWKMLRIDHLWLPTGGSAALDWGYLLFGTLYITALSNAVNLTDGLDGLAAGLSVIAFGTLGALGVSRSPDYGASALITSWAMAGSCLGFLYFNGYPAQVFMGDTGSLTLGAVFAGITILTGTEIPGLVIGGVFVIEMLSVLLQVISFKTRGKRIFKMSPIHHHFELIGWEENRVVIRFWIVGCLFAALGGLWVSLL